MENEPLEDASPIDKRKSRSSCFLCNIFFRQLLETGNTSPYGWAKGGPTSRRWMLTQHRHQQHGCHPALHLISGWDLDGFPGIGENNVNNERICVALWRKCVGWCLKCGNGWLSVDSFYHYRPKTVWVFHTKKIEWPDGQLGASAECCRKIWLQALGGIQQLRSPSSLKLWTGEVVTTSRNKGVYAFHDYFWEGGIGNPTQRLVNHEY